MAFLRSKGLSYHIRMNTLEMEEILGVTGARSLAYSQLAIQFCCAPGELVMQMLLLIHLYIVFDLYYLFNTSSTCKLLCCYTAM
jgi:hypothetical protein